MAGTGFLLRLRGWTGILAQQPPGAGVRQERGLWRQLCSVVPISRFCRWGNIKAGLIWVSLVA